MTLTKAEIINTIETKLSYSKKEATAAVETILEVVKTTLASGDDVMISGFGKFCVKEKNERKGRNPATGDALILPARRVITFQTSGKLRDKMNK